MQAFNNQTYTAMVNDLLNEALYIPALSNRGKIAKLRQYGEVVLRRLLDCSQNEKFMLGSAESRLKANGHADVTMLAAVETIRKLGNDATHTQNVSDFSDGDVEAVLGAVFDLYAYLFQDFFQRNKFGTDAEVMSGFSLLPPIIRYLTLKKLYEKDTDNPAIIDKFVLAILKSHNLNTAISWLEERKEILISMPAMTKEGFDEIKQKMGEGIANQLRRSAPSVYDMCMERVKNVSETLDQYGLLYHDFESAIPHYKEQFPLSSARSATQEFNDLMEFVYLGRRARQEDIPKDPTVYVR